MSRAVGLEDHASWGEIILAHMSKPEWQEEMRRILDLAPNTKLVRIIHSWKLAEDLAEANRQCWRDLLTIAANGLPDLSLVNNLLRTPSDNLDKDRIIEDWSMLAHNSYQSQNRNPA